MIFVSIALLVAAAIALGVGIAASSVPPLVISVLCTLAAGGTLWASFIHYRQQAAEEGVPVAGLGGNRPLEPGYPAAYAGNGAGARRGAGAPVGTGPLRPPVPEAWDDLSPADAAELVEAFNLDELHELRRHEIEHEHRDEVLARIDERVEQLVALRRKLPTR